MLPLPYHLVATRVDGVVVSGLIMWSRDREGSDGVQHEEEIL